MGLTSDLPQQRISLGDITLNVIDAGTGTEVVLLLHGVRGDRGSMLGRAALLQQHGFATLSIDLQAHGETPGASITLGSRESEDVVSAVTSTRGL